MIGLLNWKISQLKIHTEALREKKLYIYIYDMENQGKI